MIKRRTRKRHAARLTKEKFLKRLATKLATTDNPITKQIFTLTIAESPKYTLDELITRMNRRIGR